MPVPTKLATIDGQPLDPATVEGKVVLFVNVASKCGLTPQYSGLAELDNEYSDRDLVIVGVPCNQFGGQEPGTPDEIKEFTSSKYNVEFPLLEKQDVNGPNRSALYQALVGDGPDIAWNFGKFVVGRDGEVVARFEPQTPPDDPELKAAIEKALG
ncbi:glutathione peroxidase [filamentous cyanobacterium CCP5]|nr:glutathione peroxidase [filamentous cyanobacterium CCP5]